MPKKKPLSPGGRKFKQPSHRSEKFLMHLEKLSQFSSLSRQDPTEAQELRRTLEGLDSEVLKMIEDDKKSLSDPLVTMILGSHSKDRNFLNRLSEAIKKKPKALPHGGKKTHGCS